MRAKPKKHKVTRKTKSGKTITYMRGSGSSAKSTKISNYRKSGQSEIDTLESMRSSIPSKDYERELLSRVNHKNEKVRAYARKKYEKTVNPKGNSLLKEQIRKYYN